MVKASMSNTKYIIFGEFSIEGIIDKPDLIGAFFGQTEGLIGEELEFNSLQKNGKLGRIDITLIKTKGKSKGKFTIPTALDKVEVSLVAAALESVEKIGHCNGKINITNIKDDRESKRKVIISRAEELLSKLKEDLPETARIRQNVSNNYRKKLIKTYDRGKIFGGPNILSDKEIILVEGRADVLNLLKSGINNVVCFNGSNIPKFIINLCTKKEVTVFLDCDNGGKKELEELKEVIDLNYYCFAPNGFEVEELTLKEINKCLKNVIKIDNEIIKITNNDNELIKVRNNDNKKDKYIEKTNKNIKINHTNENILIIKKNLNKNENKTNEHNFNEINKENLNNIDSSKEELIKVELIPIPNNNNNKAVKKDYFSQKEYVKVLQIINEIKGNKTYSFLNKNFRKIKSGNISEIPKLSKGNGKILIFDGICEGSIMKKSCELNLSLLIVKSKSRNCKGNLNIILFEDIIN